MKTYFYVMYGYSASIWATLGKWDRWLFHQVNWEWTHPFLDSLLPFLRNSLHWAPLYLFLLVLVLQNFRLRGAWWALFFILTFAITDSSGTYLFKHNWQRLRPCMDPELAGQVRLLVKSCSGYSFISNHAANHFGLAAFFLVSFRTVIGKWAWIGFLWAAAIAYAQIYVGLHFPSDILAGVVWGCLAGSLTGHLFNKQIGFAIFGHQPISRT